MPQGLPVFRRTTAIAPRLGRGNSSVSIIAILRTHGLALVRSGFGKKAEGLRRMCPSLQLRETRRHLALARSNRYSGTLPVFFVSEGQFPRALGSGLQNGSAMPKCAACGNRARGPHFPQDHLQQSCMRRRSFHRHKAFELYRCARSEAFLSREKSSSGCSGWVAHSTLARPYRQSCRYLGPSKRASKGVSTRHARSACATSRGVRPSSCPRCALDRFRMFLCHFFRPDR